LRQAGVNNAASLKDASMRDAYDKAVKENARDLIMNELQLSLFRSNQVLTFHLLQCCSRIPFADENNRTFFDGIIYNARLTDKEVQRLSGK
jgi:hypothetical protein